MTFDIRHSTGRCRSSAPFILHCALSIAVAAATAPTPLLATPSLTAAHYVQDGLVACWDGIENVLTVAPLDSLAAVELDTNTYDRINAAKGAFTLREADDSVRGKCLELERGAANKGNAFGGVRFREPVVLDGKADTIGLWVKGNSSTGRVYFYIRDALGRPFHSTSQYHCYDWCGKMQLNYDGWRFISFPLTEASPVKIQTHAPDLANWFLSNYKKWSPPVPPVSLMGIGFARGDSQVHVNARHPIPNQSVRFCAFGTY